VGVHTLAFHDKHGVLVQVLPERNRERERAGREKSEAVCTDHPREERERWS
jgi:hypothetical protein